MLQQALTLALTGMGTVLALLLLLQGLMVLSHRICLRLDPPMADAQTLTEEAGQQVEDPVLLEVIRAAVRQYRSEQK